MDSTGRGGSDSIVGMDGGCTRTRLAESVSDTVSSEARLSPGMVGRGWSSVLGNFLPNLSTIVANAGMSFRQM